MLESGVREEIVLQDQDLLMDNIIRVAESFVGSLSEASMSY
jgi:hypothetical protein